MFLQSKHYKYYQSIKSIKIKNLAKTTQNRINNKLNNNTRYYKPR